MLAPFVKKDNLSYKEVKQCIQSFVYGVNTPSRWGTQSPFSNITIDWNCPEDLRDQPAIVGGVEQDFTYGDCKAEMDMVNKAFMEIMMEGDYDGKGFAYPIPTYSITKDFDWSESENLKMLFGMAAKYGIPYFSNYVNSDMKPSDVRSMCPLTGDTNILVMVNDRMEVVTIEELHMNKFFNENEFKVTDGYNWYSAKSNAQEPTAVRTLYNHCKKLVSMGINHLQPVYANEDGEQYTLDIEPDVNSKLITLPAKDIRAGAYIPKICGRKPGVRPVKVTSIGFDAPQPLYCLEVDSEEHIFALANGVLTHNCRLRLDLREIVKKKGGGYFGSGDKTGSTGVVTLNFPRLGYLAKDKEDFYKRLDNLLDIAARSLAVKRETVTQLMENGLYPYTKRYIGSFDTYFNTIATVGMNEMCLNANWIQKDIASVEGKEFTIEVLHHILDRLPIYQEQYGYLFNLESAPAESTCYRLAKHDRERYPDIKTAGTEKVPYYTNSSNLPVGYTGNIYEALEHQDPIQTLYTSGTVFHAYLGEALPDWKAAATIIKKICENYRLPYITLSPTFSVCPEHGYIKGEHYTCPVCESNNNKGSDFN